MEWIELWAQVQIIATIIPFGILLIAGIVMAIWKIDQKITEIKLREDGICSKCHGEKRIYSRYGLSYICPDCNGTGEYKKGAKHGK